MFFSWRTIKNDSVTLRSHQKMQKVDARRDPIQSECRDALLLCCRSICCRFDARQNLIWRASKSDLRRGMPVPAAGHGRRARSRILRRVKCCSSWNISTFDARQKFDAPQNLIWRAAKLRRQRVRAANASFGVNAALLCMDFIKKRMWRTGYLSFSALQHCLNLDFHIV